MPQPHIDEIFAAITNFNANVLRHQRQHGLHAISKCFEQEREVLKAKFTAMGLAEHIDWSESTPSTISPLLASS
jgi:oligoribonuclease (3'-5' exoribonuclease)